MLLFEYVVGSSLVSVVLIQQLEFRVDVTAVADVTDATV